MRWYINLPVRWLKEQEIASRLLRQARIEIDAENRACIHAELSLVSAHGHEWDVYRIRIVYPNNFLQRDRAPSVFLDSHHDRWKNVPETHIEDDWKLCLFVPGESGINWLDDDALEHLLACVRTFLAKERFFQRDLAMQRATGKRALWPGEARAHGVDGIREACPAPLK
jgi:hypothetical protein